MTSLNSGAMCRRHPLCYNRSMNTTAPKNNRNNKAPHAENRARRLAALFFILVFILLALCAAAVFTVDPFFHYHAPLAGFPYIVDSQRYQNPGMAARFSYDSAILGSSMTDNFDTDDFRELLGRDTIKLSSDGAYPRDLAILMDVIFNKRNPSGKEQPVRELYIALDLITLTADSGETKFPIPGYLYDRNPFNDLEYLLNRDVLLDYVAMPVVKRSPTDLSFVYGMDWLIDEWTGPEFVLRHFTPSPPYLGDESPESRAAGLVNATAENLRTNLLPYVEAHPETGFTFFFPPYSILYWYNMQHEDLLEARLEQTRSAAEELLRYDNVRIFYFQNEEALVADLNNYGDYTHYVPKVCRWMTECFSSGEKELRTDNLDAELKRTRDIVLQYDFDALFAEYGVSPGQD